MACIPTIRQAHQEVLDALMAQQNVIRTSGGTLVGYITKHGQHGMQLYAGDVADLAVALGRVRQWDAGKTVSHTLTRQDVFEAIMFTRP